MLRIREAQMQALTADVHRRVHVRLADHLRVVCSAQTAELDAKQLLLEVEAGVAHAERYDIDTERDLRVFLECRAELGADFDARLEWAAAILGDGSLFPEEKATYLSDRCLFMRGEGAP